MDHTINRKKETGVRTKMAPSYASLVLGYFEQLSYDILDHKYGNKFAVYICQNCKRFLDDCLIICNSDISVTDFHFNLNSLNRHIRLKN